MIEDLLARTPDLREPIVIARTPLSYSAALSRMTGADVWLKCEHLMPTGSFKLRGASRKLAALGEQAKRGVIAASTGNHGMAVAFAAGERGVRAHVFSAHDAPAQKLAAMKQLGADVSLVKEGALAAELKARAYAEENGLPYISPYNDLDMMAGHTLIAREILAQAPRTDAICVSVGGGGLLGGVGTAAKTLKPSVRMVGCWPERAAGLYDSIKAGRIVEEIEQPTLSDATAGGAEEGSVTLPICQAVMDEAVLVSEAEIAAGMRLVAEHEHWMVEGAAGVAVAGALRAQALAGKTVAIVLCGRNVALSTFLKALRA